MKKTVFYLLGLIVLIPIFFEFAAAQTKSSVFTEINDKTCRGVENDPNNGILYDAICDGIGKYKISFSEGDLRQFIGLEKDGKFIGPNLSNVNNTIFSYVEKKLEWRVIRSGGKIIPVALIVDYRLYYSPDTSDKAESFLIVIKITKDSACVTDFVKPDESDRNTKARKLADQALQKPCYEGEEIWRKGEEFSDPKQFVNSISNEKVKLVFEAEGDLNGDGLKDWAGIFTKRMIDKEFGGDREMLFNQLFILTKNTSGKYNLTENSKEGCPEESVCWVEDLEIKNSSVYLTLFSKSDAPTASIFQFKFRNYKWQLIGFKTNKAFPVDEKTGNDSGVEIDRNLLTGNVIEKKWIGEKLVKIIRSKRKFPELQLRDFEFYYESED